MTDRSVSVIIPAYLAEHSLPKTLDSVFAQTHPPHEVFVVNDGSPDGTAAVARSYGNQIIYLHQENQGQGAARNRGLERATGRSIAFLDADDYWLPTFLEKCVGFLAEHPEVVAVSTGLVVKGHKGDEVIRPALLERSVRPRLPFVIRDFFEFWAAHDHVRTGSNVIRREIVEAAGYQRADLRISQDLEYWGYIATFGKWGFVPEPLWVGNSRAASRQIGWFRKYRSRRKLCPTVEQWEERIVPRLNDSAWASFEVVRGRLAAMYAHSMILARRGDEAHKTVLQYGDSLPRSPLTSVLRWGANGGRLRWSCACLLVHVRELQHALC